MAQWQGELHDELFNRREKVRMSENEAVGQEFAGHDATALDEQFGFGAQEERAHLQQPARRGQAERGVTDPADRGHEFCIGHRVGRREIHGTDEFLVLQDPFDRAAKILLDRKSVV